MSVAACARPLYVTVDEDTKLEPVTVTTRAPAPATTAGGEIEVIVGDAPLVIGCGFAETLGLPLPPPPHPTRFDKRMKRVTRKPPERKSKDVLIFWGFGERTVSQQPSAAKLPDAHTARPS